MSLQYQVSYKEHIAKFPRLVAAASPPPPPVFAAVKPKVVKKASRAVVQPKRLTWKERRALGYKMSRD